MNYWSARSALGRVVDFRNAYVDYSNARIAGDPERAWAAQQRMAHLAGAVCEDLDRVRIAHVMLRDAPILGGRERPTNLAAVSLHSELADEYNVQPAMVLTMWQVAIGEHQRAMQRELWNVVNPVWWLAQAIGLVVRLPFYILGGIGFDQRRAEASSIGRLYRFVAGALGFIAPPFAILSAMKNLGWLEPFVSAVQRLVQH